MIRRLALCCAVAIAPLCSFASELTLPSAARQLAERVSPFDSYALPVGPFHAGSVPTRRFEGLVDRKTWRINGVTANNLQLLAPLRTQLQEAGYDLVFECKDRDCGGFDFRFETEVVPAPNMHVDIRNYRFVSAVLEPDRAISVLVSRSRSAAYIQIIRVAPEGVETLPVIRNGDLPAASPVPVATDLVAVLQAEGHVVLNDLDFQSGSDTLGPGPHDSLKQLALFLQANPDQRIALVGHTDSVGSLDANVALSRRRAESVRNRLVEAHGAAAERVDAEGMGYLAPMASNLTPEGRVANRRVEAILLTPR